MKQTLIASFLIVLLAFSIGFTIGKKTSNPELTEATELLKENELNMQSLTVEQQLLTIGDCQTTKARMQQLSQELYSLGKLLTEKTESQIGKQNYNFLKRRYHLMQIRTYLLYNQIQERCKTGENVVLFYYGNNDESQQQGKILDQLVQNYDIRVFAIEYNYSKELNFQETYYGIDKTPYLIINYKTKMPGLTSYDQLTNELWTKEQKQ